VTLKPSGGSAFDIDFEEAKEIDLLALQGEFSEPLLLGKTLPAGRYNWLRLKVVANETSLETGTDSRIVIAGKTYPLYIPSGDQSGLKLNRGFNITDGGAATFTIDFDLRKSIVAPNNSPTAYKLKPTLRIVDQTNVGHISGIVGAASFATCPSPSTTFETDAIYVYDGLDVTPDEEGGTGSGSYPMTSASVNSDGTYVIGFLNAGNYTLAYTCDAAADTLDADEAIIFFNTTVNAIVEAGSTLTPAPDFP
jgi:hypothetical protein